MTLFNGSTYPGVTEILKITDTAEGNGVYMMQIKIQFAEDTKPEEVEYISRPGNPHGVDPKLRQWLSENPDATVHAYEPRAAPTPEEARAAMPPLTARQLRLGLFSNGIALSQVQAKLDACRRVQTGIKRKSVGVRHHLQPHAPAHRHGKRRSRTLRRAD